MNRIQHSNRIVIRCPIGENVQLTAPGRKVFVESCSAPFKLRIGDNSDNIVKSGLRYNSEGPFDRLLITPTLAAILDAVIWVGEANVDFNFPCVPATALVATAHVLVGATPLTLPGIATADAKYSSQGVAVGQRRKQFVVTNRMTNNMSLKDAAGTIFASINGTQDYTIETDATILVAGTAGDTIYVAETFYL